MFIDYAKIKIKAGDGGAGCVAFRREKFVPKGGPSGGDGGRGGDVIVEANYHMHTLLDFQYQRLFRAQRGEHGEGSNKTGKNGQDVVIKMPVGTVIKDVQTNEILVDLTMPGQRAAIALGGRGGRGNAHFATPTNQAPREWETGGEGEEREILLELKLIADVGLVGLPNAGKSTLLSRISAARPKIAAYPFTTLSPNLGIVYLKDNRSFVVADIPGLIEGAHLGKGLGVQFLRHIERTKILAILLDCTSEAIEDDYKTLLNELASYSPEMMAKPRLVVYTKSDLLEDLTNPTFHQVVHPSESILISSVNGDNIDLFLNTLWKLLQSEE